MCRMRDVYEVLIGDTGSMRSLRYGEKDMKIIIGLEFGGGILKGILTGGIKIANWLSLEGIILNILLFVPFGYLLPTL